MLKLKKAACALILTLAGVGVWFASASPAKAGVTQSICTVSSVGWREDIKALRVICGGTVFFNREATANPTCTLKTSFDAEKIFQTTANASLLSGKSVQIYWDTQGTCSGDLVIREMYLLN